MHERSTRPVGYWHHSERVIAAEVEAALRKNEDARRPLVTYLRDLEQEARAERGRREAIQIIASARRLPDDESVVGPVDGPYAHTAGALP